MQAASGSTVVHAMQMTKHAGPLQAGTYSLPPPGPGETLLRVEAAGLCHSDLHVWEGSFGKFVSEGKPLSLSHEIAGVVAATGEGALKFKPGDRVVLYPWLGCGQCKVCHENDDIHCVGPQMLKAPKRDYGLNQDGGFSDYIMVPDQKYLVSSGSVPSHDAAPYACSGLTAYSALRKAQEANLTADDYLLVIGAGGVGLNALMLAGLVTPAKVLVAEKNAEKREAALKVPGVVGVVDSNGSSKDCVKRIMSLTEGWGVKAVVDFVGVNETIQLGYRCARLGGSVVVVGLFGTTDRLNMPLAGFPVFDKTIRGSMVGTLGEFEELMAAVRDGKAKPLPVETRDISHVNQAIQDLADGKVNGRVVLTHPHASSML